MGSILNERGPKGLTRRRQCPITGVLCLKVCRPSLSLDTFFKSGIKRSRHHVTKLMCISLNIFCHYERGLMHVSWVGFSSGKTFKILQVMKRQEKQRAGVLVGSRNTLYIKLFFFWGHQKVV